MLVERKKVVINYIQSTGRLYLRNPSATVVGLFDICVCPSCEHVCIVEVVNRISTLVHPSQLPPRLLPECVDGKIRDEFAEAARVLPVSPKASAALARRCLELMLTRQNYNQSKLVKKIEAAEPELPGYLRETMDAVRRLGNVSAHPQENRETGEITEVEPHEAQLLLTILEELADHYYVKPVTNKKRLADLNIKLDSGRGSAPSGPNAV